MNVPLYRRFYAEELRVVADLRSEALVQAFATVPREAFLGPGPWQICSVKQGIGAPEYRPTPDANPERVYHNVAIAIDTARQLHNGQPSALAPQSKHSSSDSATALCTSAPEPATTRPCWQSSSALPGVSWPLN